MTTIGLPSKRYIDISGQRFGKLVAITLVGKVRGAALWRCQCDCGEEKRVAAKNLRGGVTKSCGCIARDNSRRLGAEQGRKNRTHGYSGTRIYSIWHGMIRRCNDPNYNKYADYGGRGIKVCGRWHVFEDFLSDVGEPPSPKAEIDRVDNDGPYAPENFRWATRAQQLNNKRDNRRLTLCGRIQTLTEWAAELGLNRNSLWGRIRLGWSDEMALTVPFRKKEVVSRLP